MDYNKAKVCEQCGEVYEGEECPLCKSTLYIWFKKAWVQEHAHIKEEVRP